MSKPVTSAAFILALMAAGTPGFAEAVPIHSWYAPYAVNVADGSSFGANAISFNGVRVDLTGGYAAGDSGSRHLSAQIQADPGYVIEGVMLYGLRYSFSVGYDSGASFAFSTNWTVNPAGAGSDSGSTGNTISPSQWNVNGGQGSYLLTGAWPGSNTASEFIWLTSPHYVVSVPLANSITLSFNPNVTISDAQFQLDGLSVEVYTAAAPVPEPGSSALMLVGLALAGVSARRRRP